MIKKSFFVGVLSALLFACGSSNSDEVKLSSGEGITDEEHVEEIVEPNVFIRGTFKGGAKHTLVLEADRKSTRLNSSHVRISYAVFCLKKKKKQYQRVLDIFS